MAEQAEHTYSALYAYVPNDAKDEDNEEENPIGRDPWDEIQLGRNEVA